MIIHNSKDSTFFGDIELLGGYVRPNQAKKKYASELVDYNVHGIKQRFYVDLKARIANRRMIV